MEKKKQSLFLKNIKQNPNLIINSKSGFPEIINLTENPSHPLEQNINIQHVLPSKPEFLGVNETEYKQIDEESSNILKKMTENDIENEKKELMKTLDPKLLAFFQKKGLKTEFSEKKPEILKSNNESLKSFEIEQNKEESNRKEDFVPKFENFVKNEDFLESKAKNKEIEPNNKNKIDDFFSKDNKKLFEENDEKSSCFYTVFFENSGLEAEKIEVNLAKDEKIEVFYEKQQHSLDNLFNILENYHTNQALSSFVLCKLELILKTFYSKFKKNHEIIDFMSFKGVIRSDFLDYLLNSCYVLENLVVFIKSNNLTIFINAIKCLRMVLKLIIGKNLKIFFTKINRKNYFLGSKGMKKYMNYYIILLKIDKNL